MSFGKLANASLVADTDTVVYTVPVDCHYAMININILNVDVNDATIQLAFSAADAPVAAEYIEKGAILPSNGGILERTDQMCSPGERVVVRSNKTGTVVRVTGKTIASLNV